MSTNEQEAPSEDWTYGKWYEKHGSDLNQRRRDRYKTDPAYRARIIANQRDRRANAAPVEGKSKTCHLSDGAPVLGYNIRHVSNLCGVTPSAIVGWERKGIIPKPTITGKHRFYTAKQVTLVQLYAKATDKAAVLENITNNWGA